jgi:hypothetical protein
VVQEGSDLLCEGAREKEPAELQKRACIKHLG